MSKAETTQDKRHSSLGIQARLADTGNVFRRRAGVVRSGRRGALFVVALLLLAGAGVLVSRTMRARDLDALAREQSRVYVNVVHPKAGDGADALRLPGTLRGYTESPIFARATGYVQRWTADLGQRVRQGNLLAELSTPEIDQQLAQARATADQAQAGYELAASSARRWEGLRAQDAVSQQDLDERVSAQNQARANLEAARANVKRLEELESFKRIVAPYDGLIVRRTVDVGDLVDAGSAANAPAMFTIARTDRLRVYVYVPQSDAMRIRPGMAATITQPELAGERFKGTVTRTAGAIDTTTRTMQVEIELPNPQARLLPGAYVQVALPGPSAGATRVPVNTLLFRAEGLRVAAVGDGGRISLRPVKIGRDLGDTVEVLEGVSQQDALVLNPPDSLADGDVVTVVAAAPAKGS